MRKSANFAKKAWESPFLMELQLVGHLDDPFLMDLQLVEHLEESIFNGTAAGWTPGRLSCVAIQLGPWCSQQLLSWS